MTPELLSALLDFLWWATFCLKISFWASILTLLVRIIFEAR